MKTYNKLVRDKIPEIIMSEGNVIKTKKIVNSNEYKDVLISKLKEEVQELSEALFPIKINDDLPDYDTEDSYDKITEEIADIFEVLDTIMDLCSINGQDVDAMQTSKHINKGGFKNRTYLISVEGI